MANKVFYIVLNENKVFAVLKLYKSLFVATALISISTSSVIAAQYPDRAGICYMYKADKLQTKDLCMISVYTGGQRHIADIKFKDKNYELLSGGSNFYINKKIAQIYARDPETTKKITESVASITANPHPIICFKNKSLDICYNQQ